MKFCVKISLINENKATAFWIVKKKNSRTNFILWMIYFARRTYLIEKNWDLLRFHTNAFYFKGRKSCGKKMSPKFENQNVAGIDKNKMLEGRKNLSKNTIYKQKSCSLSVKLQKNAQNVSKLGDGNRQRKSLTHVKYKYFYLSGKTKRKNTFFWRN